MALYSKFMLHIPQTVIRRDLYNVNQPSLPRPGRLLLYQSYQCNAPSLSMSLLDVSSCQQVFWSFRIHVIELQISKFFISLLPRSLWDFYANEYTFSLGLREGSLQSRSVLVSGSSVSSPRPAMVSATQTQPRGLPITLGRTRNIHPKVPQHRRGSLVYKSILSYSTPMAPGIPLLRENSKSMVEISLGHVFAVAPVICDLGQIPEFLCRNGQEIFKLLCGIYEHFSKFILSLTIFFVFFFTQIFSNKIQTLP